ncbi:hypothetical protein HQ520_13275, partial [bacterium]|nr:hypothetical protein [bacterium]
MLSGFTITNGVGTYGGGVEGNYTLACLKDNVISSNTATYGAGISQVAGEISGNVVMNNTAALDGGGIYGCDGLLSDNVITSNSALRDGGGVALCSGTIMENEITSNSCAGNGGAMAYCDADCSRNLIAWNNSAASGGGGFGCDGIFLENTISSNTAVTGAGLSSCDGTIAGNTFHANRADSHGGALYDCNGYLLGNECAWNYSGGNGGAFYGCDGTSRNDLVFSNHAVANGGGAAECGFTLQNATFWGNTAASSGGGLAACTGEIVNCILWGNSASSDSQLYFSTAPNYSCIEGWTGGGTANITSDPAFFDPSNGDFSISSLSGCADAGSTVPLTNDFLGFSRPVDLVQEARGDGSNIDIGAIEGRFVQITIDATSSTPSIAEAMDLVITGGTVILAPGVYTDPVAFNGKDVVLRSDTYSSYTTVTSTILDGQNSRSVIVFSGSESPNCIIQGVTIRNGSATYGGGILGNGTHATIRGNYITSNTATVAGGGLTDCNGVILANVLQYNSAASGGGLYNCNATVQNNTIVSNTVSANGGGIALGDQAVLVNNIVWDNSAQQASSAQVWQSADPLFSCIQDYVIQADDPTETNINDDPRFRKTQEGDFRLQGNSPCFLSGYTGDEEKGDYAFEAHMGALVTLPASTIVSCVSEGTAFHSYSVQSVIDPNPFSITFRGEKLAGNQIQCIAGDRVWCEVLKNTAASTEFEFDISATASTGRTINSFVVLEGRVDTATYLKLSPVVVSNPSQTVSCTVSGSIGKDDHRRNSWLIGIVDDAHAIHYVQVIVRSYTGDPKVYVDTVDPSTVQDTLDAHLSAAARFYSGDSTSLEFVPLTFLNTTLGQKMMVGTGEIPTNALAEGNPWTGAGVSSNTYRDEEPVLLAKLVLLYTILDECSKTSQVKRAWPAGEKEAFLSRLAGRLGVLAAEHWTSPKTDTRFRLGTGYTPPTTEPSVNDYYLSDINFMFDVKEERGIRHTAVVAAAGLLLADDSAYLNFGKKMTCVYGLPGVQRALCLPPSENSFGADGPFLIGNSYLTNVDWCLFPLLYLYERRFYDSDGDCIFGALPTTYHFRYNGFYLGAKNFMFDSMIQWLCRSQRPDGKWFANDDGYVWVRETLPVLAETLKNTQSNLNVDSAARIEAGKLYDEVRWTYKNMAGVCPIAYWPLDETAGLGLDNKYRRYDLFQNIPGIGN